MADSHEAIADNSTLSNFARSGHLDLLQKIFPQGVWTTAEVVAELERGAGKYPELLELLNAQSSWLKVVEKLSPKELEIQRQLREQHPSIRRGADSSVLAVAKSRSWLVLTDDGAMKKVAEREGIGVLGTIDILRLATQKGFITHSQARQIKADMEAKARFQVKDPEP